MKKKQVQKASLPKPRPGETPAPVVCGFKYLRLVGALLQALHEAGTERDQAGNRQLFYDQYATLLLLYFFTPTVTSLRGVQQLSARSRPSVPVNPLRQQTRHFCELAPGLMARSYSLPVCRV